MVAKARVIPNKTAPRAPLPTAPTAELVLKVLEPRGARPEIPVTTVDPETTTTMAIIARLVVPGPRWSLVVIALGNQRATLSLRLQEKDVPAERPADDVFPALVFDNVETRWQLSQIRLADSRISFKTLWLPSPEPSIPSLPQFAPRFLHPSPVPVPRLWQLRRPPIRHPSNPLLPPPPQPRANPRLNNPLPSRRVDPVISVIPGRPRIRVAPPPRIPRSHQRRTPWPHHQYLLLWPRLWK